MQKLYELKLFLEKIDTLRDKVLFLFIKKYWPKKISPNHLTIIRIIIGLLLFVILFYSKNNDKVLIISLFIFGALTDLFDGSVARGLKKETNLGAILDPIADRILIIPIAIYSLLNHHKWLFLIIVVLEIINSLISIYTYEKNLFIKSNIFGKIKMVLQSVVFAAILFLWPNTPNMFFIYVLWISTLFIILSIYIKFLEIDKLSNNYEQK